MTEVKLKKDIKYFKTLLDIIENDMRLIVERTKIYIQININHNFLNILVLYSVRLRVINRRPRMISKFSQKKIEVKYIINN